MWKSLIEKLKGKNGRKGFTLTEMMVVVGIIAVLCAIAIPSIVVISRNLKFKQRNDYAKTIFLAAQQNLSEMRSDGGLTPLQQSVIGAHSIDEGMSGFPAEHWSAEYQYTTSREADVGAYSLVLPTGSVESALRNQQVIIEYNPITGNVYSVFYSEEQESIVDQYTSAQGLPRANEEDRKKMMLGYYDGSGLSSSLLELEDTKAEVDFTNDQEGIVTVMIPMPSLYYGDHNSFIEGLQVTLTVTGDTSNGEFQTVIKEAGDVSENCSLDVDGQTVLITYTLDSLYEKGSFANLAAKSAGAEAGAAALSGSTQYLTEITSETEFNILPGENVTIQADVEFSAPSGKAAVKVEPGILPGVNPMFESLEPGIADGKYTLAVSNGRNLQNLNTIAPSVAATVESVIFTGDIYWNKTVAYYNEKYGVEAHTFTDVGPDGEAADGICSACGHLSYHIVHGSGRIYESPSEEAPARALPYFVPIHNASLFGTANFTYYSTGSGSQNWWQNFYNAIKDFFDNGTQAQFNSNVPTLTDELDAGGHATIAGDDKNDEDGDTDSTAQIYYLNIDTTQYCVGKAFYAGTANADLDRFTGLFSYVNTAVDNLEVVNPIIKGYSFTSNNNPATGALIGAAGYNTLVTNCGVYIDTEDSSFSRTAMSQTFYDADAAQTWYGVSGQGAVGGLVGYAKSHRTVKAELDGDEAFLAFSNCFAAVNVSGDMRGNETRKYGYSNGVGGMLGNSQLTNFYNCYASGTVWSTGSYEDSRWSDNMTKYLGLYLDGATSMGTGGFVGTSHGTRYTNCFSTGNVVNGAGTQATGGFVGLMCYDETFAYGHHSEMGVTSVAQHTVFDSCYSVGLCTGNVNGGKTYLENFSGANGRIGLTYNNIKSYYVGDYYRLLAPYYIDNKSLPNYATEYIFKDSYYLSQYNSATQDDSNKCANAIAYDDLCALLNRHHTDAGKATMLAALKTQKVDVQVVETFARSLFGGGNAWETLKLIFSGDDSYNIYFRLAQNAQNFDLNPVYTSAYGEGFPVDPWKMDSTGDTTFSYAEGIVTGTYPFPMLDTMNYYGEWPTRPLTAGIAYFEDYSIVSDGTTSTPTGYYFDRADTSSLRSYEGVTVVSDGYAIFSSGANDSISVTVNGTTISGLQPSGASVTLSSSSSPDSNSYYVTRLPQRVLAEAAKSTSFFSKLTVTINGTSYTMYFNPNVAIGHSNSSTAPSKIPSQLYIRSARQLAGLSTMSSGWGAGYNYVQQLDIDASKYTAYGYSDEDKTAIRNAITNAATIGNTTTAFSGSYVGSGGYVDQASITGFDGIFGTIARGASVKDLVLTASKAVSLGTASDDSIGLLAYVNNGTIENVDLSVTGKVSVLAKNNAGLLAGFSGGTIKDCDIRVTDAVTVTAANAGGAVGKIENASVSNSTVDVKSFTAKGANAGGFVGSAQDLTAEKLTVTASNGMTASDAAYVGGFAGTITSSSKGSSITTVSTNLTGTVSASAASGKTAAVAGVAGNAVNAAFADVHARIYGTISGDVAAGMFGTTEKVTVNNSSATVTTAITGKTAAAGIAGTIDANSEFKNTAVNLTGSSINASAGDAAGYAAKLAGTVIGGNVSMASEIKGNNAAGFACEVTGTANNCTVAGKGKINGTNNAAGFAITLSGTDGHIAAGKVTLASVDSASGYLNHAYSELTISGANAAGFILTNDATVANSTVVATVNGTSKTAGFALTNNGAIERSYSNVVLNSNATAFAGTNAGTVTNSYGWHKGGNADTTGTYTGCYFAPLGVNGKDAKAQLFNSTGASSQVSLDALSKDVLNGATGTAWFQASTYGAYPMTDNGITDYPYPMLRLHYGDWVNPPEYSYGVAYYESYLDTDGKTVRYNVQLLDTSDTTNNMAGGAYSMNTISDNVAIVDAGYALFYRTEAQISSTSMPGTVLSLDTTYFPNLKTDLKLNGAALTDTQLNEFTTHGYSLKLIDAYKNKEYKTGESLAVTVTGVSKGTATIYPGFAKAIVAKGGSAPTTFEVRTSAQLSNIDYLTTTQSAKQTMNINLPSGFTAVGFGGASYIGNSKTITTVDSGVFGTVSGKISDLTIATASTTATDGATTLNPVSGNLIGDVNGGTISNVTFNTGKIGTNGSLIGTANGTVTVKIANTVDVEGSVIGTVSGGTVTVTDGLTVGTVSGSVIGTVSGGTFNNSITTGNVSGNVIGSVTRGTVTSGTVTSKISTKTVTGKLINTVSGGTVTLTAVTVDAKNEASDGTVTYADVPTLFGAITGGTVTGETINLGSAKISGNLFTSVGSGATLSNFAVNANSMSGSLIGSVAGTVDDVDITCTAASTLSSGGILINNLTGGTVKNCDVHMATVALDVNSFVALDTNKTQLAFGGIAPKLPSGATFENNTVTATSIDVTGVDDKLAVIGGLVAYCEGNITGGSVDAVLNYTQTTSDMIGIGGLVGWMQSGSIAGTKDNPMTVSGQINLKGSRTGETGYYIGGAIAYDGSTASYQYINSSVNVSDAWAGVVSGQENVHTPAGKGNVGKFVGYVNGGTFTNCSGIDMNTTSGYQFLGEIAATAVTPAAFASTEKLSSAVTAYQTVGAEDQSYYSLDNPAKKFVAADTTKNYYNFSAKMTECYYSGNRADGQFARIRQDIGTDMYFYGQSNLTENLITYTTKAATEVVGGKMYMVLSGNNALTDSNGSVGSLATISSTLASFTNKENANYLTAIWNVDSSNKWYNFSTNRYLRLYDDGYYSDRYGWIYHSRKVELSSNSGDTITTSINNGQSYIKGSDDVYLNWSDGNFVRDPGFSAGESSQNFAIYEVTKSAVQNRANFAYSNAYSSVFVYTEGELIAVPSALNEEEIETIAAAKDDANEIPTDGTVGGNTQNPNNE